MGVLSLVGTPIGNLEDISPRAIRVLGEVDVIAAEDTRRAKILLTHYKIKTPVFSYHEQGAKTRTTALLKRLRTQNVALITDAGMPSISDPGFAIVSAAVEAGFTVDVIPGASAVATALAISGLPSHRYTFVGFLPRKAAARRRFLRELSNDPSTLILFEAPHRLNASLKDAASVLGNRQIAVCRELTKLHQEVFRGGIEDAIKHFATPRGEFTIVIEGLTSKPVPPVAQAGDALKTLLAEDTSGKEAITTVVNRFGLPRRVVYRMWLDLKSARKDSS